MDWARTEGFELVEPAGGIVAAVKLPPGLSGHAVVEHLVAHHETRAVPGEFFALPGFLRVGFGGNHTLLREGLKRLAQGVSEL